MTSLLVGILKNEEINSVKKWQIACEKRGIKYQIIDLTLNNWLEQINSAPFDLFLLKPPGKIERYKTLYDERIYIISKVLNYKTYPTFEECYIYENKKLLSYFLAARKIPHPSTYVFYSRKEAEEYIQQATLPLVGKTSIGASGKGVAILRNIDSASRYVIKAFSKKGIKRQFGPNRIIGTPQKWFLKAIKNPEYFAVRMKDYFSIYSEGQRGYVIFQDYVPHDFEWRAARIGESYFAHKKIKVRDKASGSKGIDYVDPPFCLLNFVKNICETNHFSCMAIDLFENGNGSYLVNELQAIFGHVQDFILSVGGKPGRFLYQNDNWIFEEGDFNSNESYDLRLEVALERFHNLKM